MPVTSEETTRTYTGNNSTVTPYVVPFTFYVAGDLLVTRIEANGEEVPLVLTTDYTVSGGNAETGATGSIVTTAAIPNTKQVRIDLDIPFTQPANFTDTGSFPSRSVTTALDRVTRLAQQAQRSADRNFSIIDGGNA